ncbi:MAG TPA: hypothetical protein VGN77_07920, partial [Steroidobacteraceae bacterium]|nr:hypothetical protein [Steroidobacteraceae bacterium]
MANAVAAHKAAARLGRFAASGALRQPVCGAVPRQRILHPYVINRRSPLRLFEAAHRHVDFRGARNIAVGERRATVPAKAAVHARR